MTTTATLNGELLFAHRQRYRGHPDWYDGLNSDVWLRLSTSTIINKMVLGDTAASQDYWIKIWPFVEAFTGYVGEALADFEQITWPRDIEPALVTQAIAWLKDQRVEEQWHSDLWVEDALRAGVRYHDLATGPVHGVDKVMWCAVHVQDRSLGHIPTHEELGHRIAQLLADLQEAV